MSDYEQIVVGIQTILASDAAVSPESLEEFRQPYVDAVVDVNERLRECDNLLQKGLRSEAIQLCDGESDLLDAVRVLDFPERDVWAEFVRQFRLPAPPKLLIDIAADLNEAYDLEQPLSRLMRAHRLHALAGSSLHQRIEVMRKLSEADAGNPLWAADLREFEIARLEQLPPEIEAAKSAGNLQVVAALEKEVRAAHWLESPPEALVRKAAGAHTRLRQEKACSELVKIEEALNAAWTDFDVREGRRWRAQWKSRLTLAGLPNSDPLLERAAPALEWLEGQDQQEQDQAEHAAAIAGLERALDENAPREQLERLYHAAARFEEWGVSETLERRLSERLRYLEEKEKRQRRLVVIGVLAVMLLAAGATGAGVYFQTRSATVAKHVATLENRIAGKHFAEAGRYANDLKESNLAAYQSPDFQAALSELRQLQSAEESRRQRFDAALAQAEQWLDEGAVASVQDAILLLNKTKKELANGDDELRDIESLEGRLRSKLNELDATEETQIRERLLDLARRSDLADPTDQRALAKLLQEAKLLLNRSRKYPELRDMAQGMRNNIEGMEDRRQELLRIEAALQKVTASLGNHDRYAAALRAFANEFPGTSRANAFDQILAAETNLWQGYSRWLALVGELTRKPVTEQTSAAAAVLVRKAAELEEQFGRFPLNNTLDTLLDYLKTVAQRSGESGVGIVDEIRGILEKTQIRDLYVVYTGGRKYYTRKEPRIMNNIVVFEAVTDTKLVKTKEYRLPKTAISAEQPRSRVRGKEFNWESPQQTFRALMTDDLDDLESRKKSWEKTFALALWTLTTDMGEKNPSFKMDPLLKIQLAVVLLKKGCRGSALLAKIFGPDLAELEKGRFNDAANWFNPEDQAGRVASEQAQAVMNKLTVLTRPAKGVAAEISRGLAALASPNFGPQYQWVGWLRRDTRDQWRCPVSAPPAQGATAYLLLNAGGDEGGMGRFTPIGTFSGSRLNLAPDASGSLKEGRIVYIEQLR